MGTAADDIVNNLFPPSPAPAPSDDTASADDVVEIECFVIAGVVALSLLHVLGSLRRRSSLKLLHAAVGLAHTQSYALASYTLGQIMSSKADDALPGVAEFPVWAACLLLLLAGTDGLTASGLGEVEGWRAAYTGFLVQGTWVVLIVVFFGPETGYLAPLCLIVFVAGVKVYARVASLRMVGDKHRLCESVKLVADYMEHEHRLPMNSGQRPDPISLQGYRYVVAGELRKKYNKTPELRNLAFGGTIRGTSRSSPSLFSSCLSLQRCSHLLQSSFNSFRNRRKEEEANIITVEQIWRCTGSVLRSERGSQLKDVCLSMALSKMLNRRFTDSPLAEAGLEKTHDFVFQGLLAGDGPHERAFRVIEVELAFVHDLYYTRYPYLYHMGQYLALSLPVAMIILCSWLACLLYRNFQKHSPDSIYAGTTMVLMFAVAFLEGFQMYLYMASGWFKVALIRSYVTRPVLQREGCSLFQVIIIRLLLSFKAVRPWEEKLGQYSLLHALHSSGRITNCFRCLTLFLLDKVDKGRKRGKPVKQSAQVKQAVIDSLLESDGHLTKGVRSLQNNGVHGQLSWACDEGTVTRTVLVWHVATDLCKHQLDAQAKETKRKRLSKEEEDSTAVDAAASVASDLSRYCAYLVAFEPGLLPDHRSVSALALDGAIDEARKLLRGARKMSRKCEKLMGIVDAGNGVGGGDDGEVPVVVLGARLARQLSEDVPDPAVRWKVLADFWAEMMLYVAPCDDARAHLAALAGGGEFVTHLWALLTHAGVLKRGTPRPFSSGSLAAV